MIASMYYALKLSYRDVCSPLLHQTKAIVFYSTPHKGSPLISKHISFLQMIFGFTPIMPELKSESPFLLKLNEDFINLSPRPDVLTMGEELPMKAGKYEAIVVPPSSSMIEVHIVFSNNI
jgi:hypothetical protein